MMKKMLSLLSILLFSVLVSAQVTDFSGKWKLNASKSKLSAEYSMAPKDLVIVQNGNDLGVERHSTFQDREFTISDKFTLDGKECINKGWQDSEKKSTVVVADDKKSVKITTIFAMGNNGNMTFVEDYKMDGNNLVVDTSASSSFGDRSETMVYDKQ
jgi:hypothetical protein